MKKIFGTFRNEHEITLTTEHLICHASLHELFAKKRLHRTTMLAIFRKKFLQICMTTERSVIRVISCSFLILILSVTTCYAETSKVALEKVHIDPTDKALIKRGAKFYATVCLACHTLVYMKYDKIAKEAGITLEKMPFKIEIGGMHPPDLSLITRIRGADWVYTYLHSFYVDPTRPGGFNNLVFPNTAMPNFLAPYQGQQVLAKDQSHYFYGHQPQWFDVLILQKQGSMTPEQFDAAMTEVVNFLAYAAEPYRAEQERIGYWVLGLLVILFVLVWLLKREYWKDLK